MAILIGDPKASFSIATTLRAPFHSLYYSTVHLFRT